MSQASAQLELDYAQAAQYRVAADTLVLKKQATVTLDTTGRVLLDAEVLRIEALAEGSTQIRQVSHVEYLTAQTSPNAYSATTVFSCIGRYLYFWPAPAAGTEMTMIYSYRPQPITSATTFELTGRAETLIDRVSLAYALIDDGQPELGQQELADYLNEAHDVRTLNRRAVGTGGRLQVGRRRRP